MTELRNGAVLTTIEKPVVIGEIRLILDIMNNTSDSFQLGDNNSQVSY
ncbi:MAG: hypothetical protein HAW66_07095 [Shewanella sp.]|nr:hypothetical protein [Shewanella sp.]